MSVSTYSINFKNIKYHPVIKLNISKNYIESLVYFAKDRFQKFNSDPKLQRFYFSEQFQGTERQMTLGTFLTCFKLFYHVLRCLD